MTDNLPELPEFLNRKKKTPRYPVLPALSAEDYSALKNDIKERGVMVPIEYDQEGNIIDGHHRVRACSELGITEWPRNVRTYSDDAARLTQAKKLNVARRHLNNAMKRAIIDAELKDWPGQSDRAIAKDLGISHKTIGSARRELEASGEIPQFQMRIDTKGRKRPVKKPREQLSVKSKQTLVGPPHPPREKPSTTDQVSVLKSHWANVGNKELRAVWAQSSSKARHAFLRWLMPSIQKDLHKDYSTNGEISR